MFALTSRGDFVNLKHAYGVSVRQDSKGAWVIRATFPGFVETLAEFSDENMAHSKMRHMMEKVGALM